MQTKRRTAPRYLTGSFLAMFVAAMLYWGAILAMFGVTLSKVNGEWATPSSAQSPGRTFTQSMRVPPRHDGIEMFSLPIGLFFAACLAAAAGGGLLLTSAVAFANEYDPRKQTARGRLAPT